MRIVRGHAQLQNTALLRVVSGLCRKRAAFNYDVSVTLLGLREDNIDVEI